MSCEGCLRQENWYMYFFTDQNREIYLCAKSLGKILLENFPTPIYDVSKLAYTLKKEDNIIHS